MFKKLIFLKPFNIAPIMMQNSNSAYRCVVVDDDSQFVFLLSTYIQDVPKLQLCAGYVNAQQAIDSVDEALGIDFLFLQIGWENVSGLDVAEKLRDKVKFIVFVSANGEYALDALQVGGSHYLVKPLMFSKFLTTVNEVLKSDRRLERITKSRANHKEKALVFRQP